MVDYLNIKKIKSFLLNKNKITLVLIFIILIILIIVSVFFIKNRTNKSPSTTSTSIELRNIEISKKLITWLDQQKDTRGVYSENEICKNDTCASGSSSNRSGFSVLDGKVAYENKIDENIARYLSKYADKNVVQVIQSNYLICNFLYDLHNYSDTNDDIKTLTENLCFGVKYELGSQEDYDAIFNTENVEDTTSLLNKSLQKIKEISAGKTTSNTGYRPDIFKNYGFYVSEFATRYKWKNKNEDYRGFLVTLNQFLEEYGNSNNKFKEGEECGLVLGLVTMGETKQITDLKNYGETIYFQKIITKDTNEMTLGQLLTCGLLAEKMNDETTKVNFINTIITNYYDENKGCVGQQNKSNITKLTNNIFDVKNNGIFLYLLNSKVGEK